MCGVAGIVDLQRARAIDLRALQTMTNALTHRGPDGAGVFTGPGVGLGHRRLAIIDIDGGAQPFETQNGAGALTYNGEIYNYRELGAQLRQSGVALHTQSDTEVLAEGFALYGPAFIDRLRGMFAFGYWDARSNTLTLARDRLGEKPLYYAETSDGFLVFASEISSIAASGLVALDLDPEAVADYFLYGFVPDPKSIFQKIRKLAPGSILTARRGAPSRIERYWRPQFSSPGADDMQKAQEELLSRLDDAVQAEMIADVPLGAFLSGGVDSSAIVSAMASSGARIRTCSIGFDESTYDEREYARLVARRFGAEHFEEAASINATTMIDELAKVFGEPFADPSALPTYLVAKLARQHVKVALSGDGGDEIFAGYRRYPFFVKEERVRRLAPLSLRRASFGLAGALYPKLDWAPRPVRLKTTLQALSQSRAYAYAHAMAANRPERIDSILSADFRNSLDGYAPESMIAEAMGEKDEHPLIAAQRADFATWLPGRMLTKIDRASMAHGLEVRPPLLDVALVEWAGRLDPSLKLGGGVGKRVFKAALERRLPSEILHRPKQGFSPPTANWLRSDEGPLARLKQSHDWRQSGILDPVAVVHLMKAHERGAIDASQELWTIIMFDAFLSQASAKL